ncbi:MAG: hypothetical protein AMQ74_01580 [Candidatus Methanofastidiosum methylothiophilum]|uniref:Uncharacterized protein n=1 Tax=Candidatus Methanofastidiosum methylothiophilum TaxID=1705564 RepID=A0A150IUS5_9EURY|nr:MAG: hypothetical protein AMQ74_01580 [Candidatus Methanofastidiosum methylthiophilus]NMC77408.1 hypothetical protein [Candidatus Methanofastidiosa archaeon]
MNKRYISLTIILLIAIGGLPTILGNGENDSNQCYQRKLIQSDSRTLFIDDKIIYYFPFISKDCNYTLDIYGITECGQCDVNWELAIGFKNLPEDLERFFEEKLSENNEYVFPIHECGEFDQKIEMPGWIVAYINYIRINNKGSCPIQYSWEFSSKCPCSGKQALYPKVDIEQFSVTGGATIIKDGKILTNFNVIPGVQQTFIQVENRGFFTQKDVKVKVIGLPQGVNVSIYPESQIVKAHNLGTYQATFEVGPNVPSGTYKITVIAYSDNGVFDTIQLELIIP